MCTNEFEGMGRQQGGERSAKECTACLSHSRPARLSHSLTARLVCPTPVAPRRYNNPIQPPCPVCLLTQHPCPACSPYPAPLPCLLTLPSSPALPAHPTQHPCPAALPASSPLIFMEEGASAVISLPMRSAMPGNMVVPPDGEGGAGGWGGAG